MMMNKMTRVGMIAVIAGMMLLVVMAFNVSDTYAAGGSFKDAEELTIGTQIIRNGDNGHWSDYYYINTTSNNSFYVMTLLDRINSSYGVRVAVHVYDEDTRVLDGYLTTWYDTEVSRWWKLSKNAKYYIVINGEGKGEYRFSVNEVRDDVEDNDKAAVKLTVGKEYQKTINVTNDVDWFYFNTNGNSSYYKISIINMNCGKDVEANMYNSDLLSINSLSVRTHESRYMIQKLRTNSKGCFKVKSSGTGNYKIKVTRENDPAGDVSDGALKIDEGKKVKARISCYSDNDWYKFKVPSTGKYIVNISKGSEIYIYDGNLQRLGYYSNHYSSDSGKYELGKLKKGKTYYMCVYGSKNPYNYSFKVYKKVARPGKPTITVTSGKKKAVIKYNKPSKAVKFEIGYKTGNGSWKYKTTTKTSKTIKKLKSGKTYTFKVRAFSKSNGKYYAGKWSSTKTVTILK